MKVVYVSRKEGILCMGVEFPSTTLSRRVSNSLAQFSALGEGRKLHQKPLTQNGINIIVLASALIMGVLIEVNKTYMKK